MGRSFSRPSLPPPPSQGVEGGIHSEGTAQRITDERAAAAAAAGGAAKLASLSRVRVLEEDDVGTDKESIFASAAGAKALIKTKDGALRFATVGREGVQEVEGARGTAVTTSGQRAAPGAAAAAVADEDDAYSFVVAVDGVKDATALSVNTTSERVEAERREAAVRHGHASAHSSRSR